MTEETPNQQEQSQSNGNEVAANLPNTGMAQPEMQQSPGAIVIEQLTPEGTKTTITINSSNIIGSTNSKPVKSEEDTEGGKPGGSNKPGQSFNSSFISQD